MDRTTELLMNAAMNGDAATVERLIREGADLNRRNRHNWQAIHYAARNGRNEVIRLLLDTGLVSINSLGYQNQTPLQHAVCNSHISTVELLLRNDADCNLKSNFGDTPLHGVILRFARCCYASNAPTCEWSDRISDCPLIYDAFQNLPRNLTKKCVFMAIAALMVDKFGADVYIQGNEGRTILLRIRQGYPEFRDFSHYLETLARERVANDNANNDHRQFPLPDVIQHQQSKPCVKNIETRSIDEKSDRYSFNTKSVTGKSAVRRVIAASKHGDLTLLSQLISQEVDLNGADEYNLRGIHYAVRGGHNKFIEMLLATGRVSVDSFGDHNQTPLHYAICFKRYATIELLLLNGANCNLKSSFGDTCLHSLLKAFERCCHSCGVRCEFSDVGGTSPLIYETFKNMPRNFPRKCVYIAISILILTDFGADISIRDKSGKTILDRMIEYDFRGLDHLISYFETFSKKSIPRRRKSFEEKRSKITRHENIKEPASAQKSTLFENGLKVEDWNAPFCETQEPLEQVSNNNEILLLHQASYDGDIAEVQRLLDEGFDVNESDSQGNTAIHKAVDQNYAQVLLLLLENGANINAVNSNNMSALHVGVEKTALECVEILINYDCDVNLLDINGNAAIINAVSKVEENDLLLKSRQEKIFELLAEKNVLAGGVSNHGLNCCHLAVKCGNEFAISVISKLEPRLLTAIDNFRNEPLHFAAILGKNGVIDALLKSGVVDVNKSGVDNFTAMHFAVIHSKFSTIECLIKNNAKTDVCDESGRTPLHYVFKGYNDCCSNNNSATCTLKEKIQDCSSISTIFKALPKSLRKKCVFIAVAQYLIVEGGADILIKDRKGKSPYGSITGEPGDVNRITSYFTLLYCDNITKVSDKVAEVEKMLETICIDDCDDVSEKEVIDQLEELQNSRHINDELMDEIQSLRLTLNKHNEEIQRLKTPRKVSKACRVDDDVQDLEKDLTMIFQLFVKKEMEIESLKEEIEALRMKIKDQAIEVDSLKERNKYLNSLICCVCSNKMTPNKRTQLLCGHGVCDKCCELNKRCIFCDDLNDS